MLTALGVVREKELGSIINFYVTPVTPLEFLLGKQLPYVGLAMAIFAGLVVLLSGFVFMCRSPEAFWRLLAARSSIATAADLHGTGDLGLHARPDRRDLRTA